MSTAARQRGDWAESEALEYLRRQGLRLVRKNFNCRYGEIDLILYDADTLVFAEVRYRGADAWSTPLESVDTRKQRRIVRSAEYYLQRHPQQALGRCRFDVLGITEIRGQGRFEWIRDAFQA